MAKRISRPPGGRSLRTALKGGKKRTPSSAHWLQRQLNDPYVARAKASGYRSRAAFKLIELDEKFHLLRRGARVLDLGAAPGGWSQVAAERVGPEGKIVAVDLLEIAPLSGIVLLTLDVREPVAVEAIREALGGPADLVLSDMAAATTGHRATDHLRTVALFETALDLSEDLLRPGGALMAKLFQGGATPDLLARLRRCFRHVKHVKPTASRAESVELYLVALGFRPRGSGAA